MSCPPVFRAFQARTSDKNTILELRSSSGLLLTDRVNKNTVADNTDDDWQSDNSCIYEDDNPERLTEAKDFLFKRRQEAGIVRTASKLSQLLAQEHQEAKASGASRAMLDIVPNTGWPQFLQPPPPKIPTSQKSPNLATRYPEIARPLSPHSTKANMLTAEFPKQLRSEILQERCKNTLIGGAHGSKGFPQHEEKEWHQEYTAQDFNSRGW
ncbi:hypothetical protein F4802DRAFT_591880 [Xylaria palmicola]|nr:hypothetical protein F4802DRAFT_591880 [Xylaria palmicola]